MMWGFSGPLLCQDDQKVASKNLQQEDLEDLRKIVQYEETVRRLRAKNRKTQSEEVKPAPAMNLSLGPVMTGLLYLLIAGLVLFVLFIIFSSIKVDNKIEPAELDKKEEYEDIEEIDAQEGLNQALSADNYRHAVRMLFIKLLQVLVEQQHIDWKPKKTNRDYLHEMSDHPQLLDFSNLVLAYESIWYGSEPIDKLYFDYLRHDFEKFYSTEKAETSVTE